MKLDHLGGYQISTVLV